MSYGTPGAVQGSEVVDGRGGGGEGPTFQNVGLCRTVNIAILLHMNTGEAKYQTAKREMLYWGFGRGSATLANTVFLRISPSDEHVWN